MDNVTNRAPLIGANQVPSVLQALDLLGGRPDLPASVSWTLMKLRNKANKAAQQYEEARQELLNKYGKKCEDGELLYYEASMGGERVIEEEGKKFFLRPNGDKVSVHPNTPLSKRVDLGDNEQAFMDELNEILDSDADMDIVNLRPIPISKLKDITVPIPTLTALEFVFSDD
jgi:hypothetical protein